MKILRQLFREFWLPLIIGLAWTTYNLWAKPFAQWSVRGYVNIFGPSFFFVSWLVAQWYRVRKQQKVEDGLVGIEHKVSAMLTDLESKTNDLVAHITGGDSVCYLAGSLVGPNEVGMAVVHCGAYPLYGVSARIVDIGAFERCLANHQNPLSADRCVQLGDLIPGHASMLDLRLLLGQGDTYRYNIFFSARNGSFTQLLRYRKVNGVWKSATRVERERDPKYVRVDDGFPCGAGGEPSWDD